MTELTIYFHLLGQLLRTSNVNRLSTANKENVLQAIWAATFFTDWEISLKLECNDFSAVQGPNCVQAQIAYDQCIQTQFFQQGNNSKFSQLFLDGSQVSSSLEGAPIEVVQEYYATILSQDIVNRCPKSCTNIQVQFEQKAKRKVQKGLALFSVGIILNPDLCSK